MSSSPSTLAPEATPQAAAGPVPPVRLVEVSRWYGEVLGINRVTLDILPGVTSLVGPNGCGKSTLMNLVAGFLLPSRGLVEVRGISPTRPELLHRVLGYCPQHDTYPVRFTGREFLESLLRVRGLSRAASSELATRQLERVGLSGAGRKRIGAYSKGMRQRLKLALATAHDPTVLVLDEPLDGLDPLARSDMMTLFRELAEAGTALLISSHVLHEVDVVSDQVVMLHHGYVMADGGIETVRSEIAHEPMKVRVTCDAPAVVAARAFSAGAATSARVDGDAVLLESFDPLATCRLVGELAATGQVRVDGLDVADETVQAVYDYLIRGEEAGS